MNKNKKVEEVIDKLDGKYLLYDPPSGWRYGFPKPYRPLPGETLEDTLRRDGYPQHEIDNAGADYCRFLGDQSLLNRLNVKHELNVRHEDEA